MEEQKIIETAKLFNAHVRVAIIHISLIKYILPGKCITYKLEVL